MPQSAQEILSHLRSLANPENVAGMARFGINPNQTLGISIPVLRSLARQCGTDHPLAQALWATGVHEARILAAFVDDPHQVSEDQMEAWVMDFDSWDVCDQVCSNLFDHTTLAYQKAVDWSERQEEFVKRAGFVMMAALATHDKKAADSSFEQFFPLIMLQADDERNFVKKAINWALRGIGKRNHSLNQKAIETARLIAQSDSRAAHWVAVDALRELTSAAVQKKIAP